MTPEEAWSEYVDNEDMTVEQFFASCRQFQELSERECIEHAFANLDGAPQGDEREKIIALILDYIAAHAVR